MSDQSGGDQPVQVDPSQFPITLALAQQQPSDQGSLLAMLGVDTSQQGDTQTA